MEQQLKILYLAIASLLLLLAIIFYILLHFRYKRKVKQHRLLQTYETEEKIGRRLHDEMASDVFLLMVKTANLNTSNLEETKSDIKDNLDKLYQKIRIVSHELNFNKTINLIDLINDLLAHFSNNNTKIVFNTKGFEKDSHFSEVTVTTVYRCLQELLNNAVKHSNATVIHLEIVNHSGIVRVRYQDDGIGFDEKTTRLGGLRNIKERVNALRGRVQIKSIPTHGTSVQIEIPKEYDKSIVS